LAVQLVVMNYRTVFKPKVFISCGLAFALLWTFLPDEQKERFQTIGEDKTSQQRILYWENGIEMIKEHPVLGVGYFNFPLYYGRYYPDDVLRESAQLPHNIFIQIGTDTGLLGLAVFSGFLLVAYRLGRRFKAGGCKDQQTLIGRCANLSLLGFVVAGQFVTVAYYPFLWIHLALVVALNNSFKDSRTQTQGRS
jgi:putative inorganic carbon (HCO3(-)) transporter